MSKLEKNIKEFYETDGKTYKYHRWERNPIMKFDYQCTKEAIEQVLSNISGSSVLEIGPGPGTWTEFLVAHFEVVHALDISSTMIEQAKQNPKLSEVEFTNANFADFETTKTYDAIFSVRSFEYFDDKEAFIQKASQLLNPNGHLVILTKNARSYWFGRTKVRTVLQKIFPFLLKYDEENVPEKSRKKINLFKQKRTYPSQLRQLYKKHHIQYNYHYPVIARPPIFMRGKTEIPLIPPSLEKATLSIFRAFNSIIKRIPYATFFAEGFVMVGKKGND